MPQPPRDSIAPNLAPGGLVFHVIIDNECVEECRRLPTDSDTDIAGAAERHRQLVVDAVAANRDAGVEVYDGDSGALLYQLLVVD